MAATKKRAKKTGGAKGPHVVGVEVLRQNGLDVDELVRQLVVNSSVEFTAY